MEGQKPAVVVGVRVTQHESVAAIQEVEERTDVEGETGWTRGRRRHVEVDDGYGFVIDDDGNPLQFNARAIGVNIVEVDVYVAQSMMDKKEETTTTVACAIATNHHKAIEIRVTRRRIQLCFLDSCYDHVVFFYKHTELDGRRPSPVAIKLKET